jgi:hypothetical protein
MTENITLVVDYLDDRNESIRTAVVTIPADKPELIPLMLRKAGRRVRRVLKYHPEGKPGEVTRWT